MAARRQVTNKLRGAYRRASKGDKGRILDQVVETTGLARSSARRLLSGPALPDPVEQVDGRTVRQRVYSDDARALTEHVWALMGMPCGKYLVVHPEDLDMPDATFACPDLTSFCRLDALGLEVVGQRLEPSRAVLACRVSRRRARSPVRPPRRPGCASRHGHASAGARTAGVAPATLQITVRRYRCGRVWRQDTSKAAEPRAKLSRRGLRWDLEAIVCQHPASPKGSAWRGTRRTPPYSLRAGGR